MKSKRYLLVLLWLCLVPVFPVLAVGSGPDEAAIAEMIRELGDRRYAVRQAAAQKLRQAGIAAVPALEVAAQSDDPEVAMTARALLPDARLGLGPSWPADLAEQARRVDQLSQREKTALLRQVMTRIPDPDTVAQFLLARLSTGNPDEAAAILAEAMSTGNTNLAQRFTEVIKPPMNDGQAVLLAWSWMVKGHPTEALTALAQCGSEVSEVSTMRRQIIGKGVTSIGASAFSSYTNLNSITIPDGVTRIGNGAFRGCTSLSNITIGNGVTNIGNYAFYKCTSLANISVAGANPSYRSIGGVLFDKEIMHLIKYPVGHTNKSYTIPESVTSIGNGAFSWSSLSSIIIPDSVTSIGNTAFQDCTNLISISIPDSVTSIGNRVFLRCTSLTNISVAGANPSYRSIGGVLFDKEKTHLIKYPVGNTNLSCTIPDSVARIGISAFYSCSSLTDITIPDSVTSIGDSAFQDCTSLTDITIPGSVTRIERDAFRGCTNLTSITIPGSVTSIGDSAFQDCTSLTDITIPDSVTYIGNRVFLTCTSLTDIAIGTGVTTIRNSSFYSCTSLTDITIPDSVTNIGLAAFKNCTNLTSIIIPDSVTSIESKAFASCPNLTSVKFKGNGPISTGPSVFLNSTPTIYRLSTATGWGDTFAGRPVMLWDE